MRRCDGARRASVERPEIVYIRTDGANLPGVETESVDVVWSFEAFVHMLPVDVAAYVGEIARVLRPGGTAVIHHAGRLDRSGWRAPMSAALVRTPRPRPRPRGRLAAGVGHLRRRDLSAAKRLTTLRRCRPGCVTDEYCS